MNTKNKRKTRIPNRIIILQVCHGIVSFNIKNYFIGLNKKEKIVLFIEMK